MSLSPFEHPFLSGLFEDSEIAAFFSAKADIEAMIAFESALARAEAEHGIVSFESVDAIERLARSWHPDIDALKAGVRRDGVVVPDLIAQMRKALGEPHASQLHFGATSQDVIDTSLVLRLKTVLAILEARIARIEAVLENLSRRFGSKRLMGRTRMQDALEIAVSDKLADWTMPLPLHRRRLEELKPRLLQVQFGGAVGTREKLGDKGQAIARSLGAILDLGVGDKAWHTQRDGLVELGGWLTLIAGSLGKIGQDVALMAQAHDGTIALTGGGGSSAMPHKSNPVSAEILVSLARYVAGSNGTLAQAIVHEQERSGAAWTLEWLVLPQMVMATGSALLVAERLLQSVVSLGR